MKDDDSDSDYFSDEPTREEIDKVVIDDWINKQEKRNRKFDSSFRRSGITFNVKDQVDFAVTSAKHLFVNCAFTDFNDNYLIINEKLVHRDIAKLLDEWITSNAFLYFDNVHFNFSSLASSLGSILRFEIDMRKRHDEDLEFTRQVKFFLKKWAHNECWNFHRKKIIEEAFIPLNPAVLVTICLEYLNNSKCRTEFKIKLKEQERLEKEVKEKLKKNKRRAKISVMCLI
jgi:hypothetical protein